MKNFLRYTILAIIITVCFSLTCVIVNTAFATNVTPGGGGVNPNGEAVDENGNAIEFRSPIEPTTLPELIKMISSWLSGIVGAVAVLMIMVGGFQYVISTGDPAKTKAAINYIKYAVIGLVIIFGANIIISEINSLLYGSGTGSSFFDFTNRAIPWMFGIIVGVSVLSIIYAGYLFMIGGDDPTKVKQAQSIIKFTVVGLVVASLAAFIVKFVTSIF